MPAHRARLTPFAIREVAAYLSALATRLIPHSLANAKPKQEQARSKLFQQFRSVFHDRQAQLEYQVLGDGMELDELQLASPMHRFDICREAWVVWTKPNFSSSLQPLQCEPLQGHLQHEAAFFALVRALAAALQFAQQTNLVASKNPLICEQHWLQMLAPIPCWEASLEEQMSLQCN